VTTPTALSIRGIIGMGVAIAVNLLIIAATPSGVALGSSTLSQWVITFKSSSNHRDPYEFMRMNVG
jgi:uncharacterized membrane protein YfcA